MGRQTPRVNPAHLDSAIRLDTERDFSGSVLITRAGHPVHESHHGLADRTAGTPITSRTRFGLGSVTKVFTAVAVLDLVAEGRLALDDRVATVLPPERRPATPRDDVTVRHLLTHTSGIADYFEEETATADWATEFAALWADRPVYRMLAPADFLDMFGALPPYRAPGVRYQYSNAGYILLGLVIEAVTGDYHTTAERLFTRAGSGSGFLAADEVHENVATGYLRPRNDGEQWRTNVFAVPAIGGPDGGSFATAADLDRFLTALTAGELVPEPLLTEALRPHATINDNAAMGHGVYLLGTGRSRAIGAEGAGPGAEALIRHYPELGVNTVVLSNVDDSAWTLDHWRARRSPTEPANVWTTPPTGTRHARTVEGGQDAASSTPRSERTQRDTRHHRQRAHPPVPGARPPLRPQARPALTPPPRGWRTGPHRNGCGPVPRSALVQEGRHLRQVEESRDVVGGTRAEAGIGARGEQLGDVALGAAEDRRAERCLAPVVDAGRVRVPREQGRHRVRVVVVGGQYQQRVSRVVGEVHRYARVDRRGEAFGVTGSGEVEHRAEQREFLVGERHDTAAGKRSHTRWVASSFSVFVSSAAGSSSRTIPLPSAQPAASRAVRPLRNAPMAFAWR